MTLSSATEIWFQGAAGLSSATEGRTAEHGQADAALGLLFVVELITLLGLPSEPYDGACDVLITRLRMVRCLIFKGRRSASTGDMSFGSPSLLPF